MGVDEMDYGGMGSGGMIRDARSQVASPTHRAVVHVIVQHYHLEAIRLSASDAQIASEAQFWYGGEAALGIFSQRRNICSQSEEADACKVSGTT